MKFLILIFNFRRCVNEGLNHDESGEMLQVTGNLTEEMETEHDEFHSLCAFGTDKERMETDHGETLPFGSTVPLNELYDLENFFQSVAESFGNVNDDLISTTKEKISRRSNTLKTTNLKEKIINSQAVCYGPSLWAAVGRVFYKLFKKNPFVVTFTDTTDNLKLYCSNLCKFWEIINEIFSSFCPETDLYKIVENDFPEAINFLENTEREKIINELHSLMVNFEMYFPTKTRYSNYHIINDITFKKSTYFVELMFLINSALEKSLLSVLAPDFLIFLKQEEKNYEEFGDEFEMLCSLQKKEFFKTILLIYTDFICIEYMNNSSNLDTMRVLEHTYVIWKIIYLIYTKEGKNISKADSYDAANRQKCLCKLQRIFNGLKNQEFDKFIYQVTFDFKQLTPRPIKTNETKASLINPPESVENLMPDEATNVEYFEENKFLELIKGKCSEIKSEIEKKRKRDAIYKKVREFSRILRKKK